MSRKIILSFTASFSLMAILFILAYGDFIKIIEDIRTLETTDRVRNKTLEMRRYEKNFLNGDDSAAEDVLNFTEELRDIVQSENVKVRADASLKELNEKIGKYSGTFEDILGKSIEFQKAKDELVRQGSRLLFMLPLVSTTYREHPLENMELLRQAFPQNNGDAINLLRALAKDVAVLRKQGDELISTSKNLDRSARNRIEYLIKITQYSALVIIPVSFALGIALLFKVSRKVVIRLKELENMMDKASHGYFPSLPMDGTMDEVEHLKGVFNKMSEELRHRQDQINSKDEQLHQSRQLSALGTLSSGVAHELNNPLNNIHLAAQTLHRVVSKGAYPEIITDSVQDIHSQTMRMKKIVGDLMDFAKNKRPQYEQFELYSLLADTYKRLGASADLSSIVFSIEGDGFISASRPQLEQVFINLFVNAVDAMRGSGTLRVTIATTPDEAVIKISDTGAGIAEGDIERVFEPFFTNKGSGTGLGLFITYNIIKNHKGTITVESAPDVGTTFTVTLPLRDKPEEL
ncbi:ATP-binding protein [Candidatus Magnetominusculus dajiuhuensis]|uniref:sensor histidine kinase n=1 Tax=Candidatus Magnetominusculus dajiuhuensis TaxID=3137712 RepID=UPI003B427DBA